MKRLLPFLILILIFGSCSLSKEARRSNRAADLIEKAMRIDPSVVSGREVEIPVTLEIPERKGSIDFEIKPLLNSDSLIAIIDAAPDQAPRIIRQIVEMPCEVDEIPFEDSLLVGTFTVENGKALFDYTIKADSVSGSVTAMTDTINPTRVEKPGLLGKINQLSRLIIYLIAAFVVGIAVGKFLL